jgi:hypothetical protein
MPVEPVLAEAFADGAGEALPAPPASPGEALAPGWALAWTALLGGTSSPTERALSAA